MDIDLRTAGWMARCVGRGEFAPFTEEEIGEFRRRLGVRAVAPGGSLLRQGEPSEHIGIIVSGEVELFHRRGPRRVVLQVLRPGDVYGDVPFLCALPMPYGARALTEGSVIDVPHAVFWALLEQRPQVARRLLFSLASRLERMQRRLLALTSGDLAHQVGWLLLDETGPHPATVRLSQATIAELLGTTRPSVNRALRTLASQGYVRLSYRQIAVIDPEGLDRALA